MAGPVDSPRTDDELLVAYLDGALENESLTAIERRLASEPDLQHRLSALRRSDRRFGDAFAILLAGAPADRLAAMVRDATVQRPTPAGQVVTRRWAMAAAALAIFAAGALAGYLIRPPAAPLGPEVAAADPPNWRQAVAGYQSYISAETMEIIAGDPTAIGAEVAAAGTKLSLDLTADSLALEHVYLKRVQLFDYRDRPLVQFAYLSPADGPISFCIIANGRPDEAMEFEQRDGFNIVYWNKDGRGYLVIGRATRETLESLAGDLAQRVG
jgi:anti-sigma factor RsiW